MVTWIVARKEEKENNSYEKAGLLKTQNVKK
jgi:hypothetical protein